MTGRSEQKRSGSRRDETGEGSCVRLKAWLHEIGARFPSSERTQVLLADMVTWCLAEYYRESA